MFQPDELDDMRRVVADGRPEYVLARALPTDVSIGAAAELACWSCTPEFLEHVPLRNHIRAWCRNTPILGLATRALWEPSPGVREEDGPMAFLSCPTTETELLEKADALDNFGVCFLRAAVRVSRFDKEWVGGLWKTVWDLVENIAIHARVPELSSGRGLLGFRATPNSFEFVVADTGQGALASLRANPHYADLPSSQDALRAIVREGASASRGPGGAGGGIQVMFKKIASRQGQIRFRSGDSALRIEGDLTQARERTGSSPSMPGLQVYIHLHSLTK